MFKLNQIALLSFLIGTTFMHAATPAFHNQTTNHTISIKMQLSGADQKQATLAPGQSKSFETGGWCISDVNWSVDKGPLAGEKFYEGGVTQVTNYLAQKDTFPFAGLRCPLGGSMFNVYFQEETRNNGAQMRLKIQDSPNGGYVIYTNWKDVPK